MMKTNHHPVRVRTIMQGKEMKVESFLKEKRMVEKNETIQSAVSYGLGCGSMFLGWICQATDFWQALALFVGVIIVTIRAVHDAIRLVRYIVDGK